MPSVPTQTQALSSKAHMIRLHGGTPHAELNHSQHETTPFSEMYSSRNLVLAMGGETTSMRRDQEW
ncbi:uncharacterized protein LACBIDRAFT_307618 [Laccaria bicolor S238N-H82]|uniref:Predicted protein n=1 Tax=Laccaria bicolor (strain S238N-H82 / ATCC MYA-4686) TaxID=486041 RepID=B0DQL0_LACBS|nr:uncharacterized protein LACBIDRAFT_307618 [Laccaria bicolor S238N-H82]EDR03134.1 predicted protein [Laccaria bicolor S238N-H82]|eukprot:XP_001886275.1 predicted protein [Laccaria bicolor S238N-H82]